MPDPVERPVPAMLQIVNDPAPPMALGKGGGESGGRTCDDITTQEGDVAGKGRPRAGNAKADHAVAQDNGAAQDAEVAAKTRSKNSSGDVDRVVSKSTYAAVDQRSNADASPVVGRGACKDASAAHGDGAAPETVKPPVPASVVVKVAAVLPVTMPSAAPKLNVPPETVAVPPPVATRVPLVRPMVKLLPPPPAASVKVPTSTRALTP